MKWKHCFIEYDISTDNGLLSGWIVKDVAFLVWWIANMDCESGFWSKFICGMSVHKCLATNDSEMSEVW